MGMLGPLGMMQKQGSAQHLVSRADPKTWHSLDLDPHNMRPPPFKTQRSSSMPTPKVILSWCVLWVRWGVQDGGDVSVLQVNGTLVG